MLNKAGNAVEGGWFSWPFGPNLWLLLRVEAHRTRYQKGIQTQEIIVYSRQIIIASISHQMEVWKWRSLAVWKLTLNPNPKP